MKKGFTLIELLAVIVVLAILALVVTPIVLNIVENAQQGSDERSLEQYAKIMQTSYYEEKMKDPSLTLEEYLSKVETASGATLTYNGSKVVCSEKIAVETVSGTQSIELINCTVDGRGPYNFINGSASKEENKIVYNVKADGDIVYFDVKTGKTCDNYHKDNSKTGYNGINPTGNQTNCLKFYAFNVAESSDRFKLILDHNTTASVAWGSNNKNGPSTNSGYVLYSLKSATSAWKGTIEPSNYSMDQTGKTSNAKYTIDYSGYKARLITANEIAKIAGKTSWNESSGATFNFSGAYTYGSGYRSCPSSGCKYKWLYENSGVYWTASSVYSSTSNVFYVSSWGDLSFTSSTSKVAIRPVIEVLKSKIS